MSRARSRPRTDPDAVRGLLDAPQRQHIVVAAKAHHAFDETTAEARARGRGRELDRRHRRVLREREGADQECEQNSRSERQGSATVRRRAEARINARGAFRRGRATDESRHAQVPPARFCLIRNQEASNTLRDSNCSRGADTGSGCISLRCGSNSAAGFGFARLRVRRGTGSDGARRIRPAQLRSILPSRRTNRHVDAGTGKAESAVDHQIVSGDEARLLREQEDDGVGHVLGGARAAERRRGDHGIEQRPARGRGLPTAACGSRPATRSSRGCAGRTRAPRSA